jgi:hypothetical protein
MDVYVIKKPRERGGHRPCWAAVPDKIIVINIIIIIIYFTNYDVSLFFQVKLIRKEQIAPKMY